MSRHILEAGQNHIYISLILKGNGSELVNTALQQRASHLFLPHDPDLNSGLSIKKEPPKQL